MFLYLVFGDTNATPIKKYCENHSIFDVLYDSTNFFKEAEFFTIKKLEQIPLLMSKFMRHKYLYTMFIFIHIDYTM